MPGGDHAIDICLGGTEYCRRHEAEMHIGSGLGGNVCGQRMSAPDQPAPVAKLHRSLVPNYIPHRKHRSIGLG